MRLWFTENQYQATRISTVAKWDYGSRRTNIRQHVSQLSLSEIMVQGEPISGNSILNCCEVRLWFRENQYQATHFLTIAIKWERGSGRTILYIVSSNIFTPTPWNSLSIIFVSECRIIDEVLPFYFMTQGLSRWDLLEEALLQPEDAETLHRVLGETLNLQRERHPRQIQAPSGVPVPKLR